MNTSFLILGISASLLVFLYLSLSVLVIVQRYTIRCSLNTCGDPTLAARMRAHANFSEYTPITLILMGIAIALRMPSIFLAVLGGCFVIARYIHAFALFNSNFNARRWGMIGTFLPMLVLAIYNLIKSLLFLLG